MPKIAPELSPAAVRNLMDEPGLHAVGGVNGLLLQVSRGKSRQLRRSWILRTMVGARRRDIGLGSYPTVTLGIARDRAREAREQIRAGIDPIEERRRARADLIARQASTITFSGAAAKVAAMKAREFRNRKHAAQWSSTLETYANPVIGKLPVADVALEHVVSILEPIWLTKTETAKRLRGRIEAVLAWAIVSGYRTADNVARWKGNLDAVLPKPGKVAKVEHFAAVPIDDVGAFMRALRRRDGMAARALEFAVLTAARSGEVRGAKWSEIDLQSKTWVVPAARMKAHKEHRVPLSDDAMAVLTRLDRTGDLVFPAPRGGMLSDMTLTAVLRRMKVDATVHGFRSTFKDWASERTAYPNEISEAALAHINGDKVEAAYRRGTLFEKRRRLMRDWARFCGAAASAGDKVVPLAARRA
jgi:integrase